MPHPHVGSAFRSAVLALMVGFALVFASRGGSKTVAGDLATNDVRLIYFP